MTFDAVESLTAPPQHTPEIMVQNLVFIRFDFKDCQELCKLSCKMFRIFEITLYVTKQCVWFNHVLYLVMTQWTFVREWSSQVFLYRQISLVMIPPYTFTFPLFLNRVTLLYEILFPHFILFRLFVPRWKFSSEREKVLPLDKDGIERNNPLPQALFHNGHETHWHWNSQSVFVFLLC